MQYDAFRAQVVERLRALHEPVDERLDARLRPLYDTLRNAALEGLDFVASAFWLESFVAGYKASQAPSAGAAEPRDAGRQVKFTTTEPVYRLLEGLAREGRYGRSVPDIVAYFIDHALSEERRSRAQRGRSPQ